MQYASKLFKTCLCIQRVSYLYDWYKVEECLILNRPQTYGTKSKSYYLGLGGYKTKTRVHVLPGRIADPPNYNSRINPPPPPPGGGGGRRYRLDYVIIAIKHHSQNDCHCNIISWEPEGHCHYSTMFRWEPECHYGDSAHPSVSQQNTVEQAL